MVNETSHISIYEEACNGHAPAWSFLLLFNQYCHAIDDIIDDQIAGKPRSPEFIISTFALAPMVYGHPFYLSNIVRLQPVILLITNAYADSVKWEHSDKDHLRSISDVLRFCGNEMVFAIAIICGGYDHLRKISSRLREDSWVGHHTEKGIPV